ncbi:MAG TPA: hypothetical protein VID72_01620, partial [Ktedonobacterales bacterium]
QGHAIYAMVEGLRGRDALMVLSGWGQCRFAFEPNAPRPAPNVTEPHPMRPAARGGNSGNSGNGAPGSGSYPPPQRSQPTPTRPAPGAFNWNAPGNRPLPDPLPPASQPGALPSQQRGPQTGPQTSQQAGAPPTPAFGASWPTGWPPSAPSNGSNTSGQLRWPQTGGLPSTQSLPSAPSSASTPSQSTGPFAGGAALSREVLERRPRRAPDVRDLISVVSAYNLSRNHRTILLLADGEHTVLDLARLSSKPVDEIVALLAELERVGLVYYY